MCQRLVIPCPPLGQTSVSLHQDSDAQSSRQPDLASWAAELADSEPLPTVCPLHTRMEPECLLGAAKPDSVYADAESSPGRRLGKRKGLEGHTGMDLIQGTGDTVTQQSVKSAHANLKQKRARGSSGETDCVCCRLQGPLLPGPGLGFGAAPLRWLSARSSSP